MPFSGSGEAVKDQAPDGAPETGRSKTRPWRAKKGGRRTGPFPPRRERKPARSRRDYLILLSLTASSLIWSVLRLFSIHH